MVGPHEELKIQVTKKQVTKKSAYLRRLTMDFSGGSVPPISG
jgi:hypothetical protein